jgi:hypothetical protein
MTFEEAKKILKKEGFELEKVGRPCSPTIVFTAYESPEICEAMQVVCSAGYSISMVSSRFDDRKARLSLELAENSAPMPGPGEEQPEEKKRIICCSASPKADFYYKHVLDEGNPALAESASQFNDALLDEQGKKIAELTKDKELMKKASLSQLDDFIEIYNLLTKESQKTKRLGKEIAKLNGIIHDKNAILSDVAEELRLSKIRENNLVEVSQKYMKENEELNDKLKSINKNRHNELAEKDEMIADLGKELAEAKKQNTAVMVDMTAKCLGAARESINDVFESYAAKYAKSTLDELKEKAYNSFNAKACNLGCIGSKDGNGIIDQMVGADIAEEGGDNSGVIVLCGKDFIDAIKKMK